MTRLLPLFFLAGFAAEVTSIIIVGNILGVFAALLLLFAGGVTGIGLIRSAGSNIATALRAQVQGPFVNPDVATDAMARVIAGIFFLIPGFFSDFLGLLLLLPPVRMWLTSRLPKARSASANQGRAPSGTIIEGEAIEIVADIQSSDRPSRTELGGSGQG